MLVEQSKGESVMKGDRRNRIDELKRIQRQKQFIHMLEARNYPSYQLLATNADEEIWNKINQGRVIERIEDLSLEFLSRKIDQIFSNSEELGIMFHFGTESFLVQFNKNELVWHIDKVIDDLSKCRLLYLFVFSSDLSQILLLEESEYDYYEMTYYDKNFNYHLKV